MNVFKDMTYTRKIKWRIRILYLMLISILVYIVVVSELGGGDSRIMTDLAQSTYRFIGFWGMIYIGVRIHRNKKLLADYWLCKEQMRKEQDERNQYLHDKSGGTVMDLMLVCLLIATETAALFNMPAFYTAFALLVAAVVLKGAAYWFYSRR